MAWRPSVALWIMNFGCPAASLDAWLERTAGRMAEAAQAGADLLMMPEYACMEWLAFRPQGLAATEEVAWMGEQAARVLPRLEDLVQKTGIGLLAGTLPAANGGSWTNRAYLLLPENGGVRCVSQDKLCLTPFENDPAGWTFVPGREFTSFQWRGLRAGILICLDVELPSLAARLAPLGLDILFVPSMTEREAGFHRVFGCARARAVELQTIVCVVGAAGTLELGDHTETNVSGAAVYLPCEESLGHTGILAAMGPMPQIPDPRGALLIARDLPVAQVRALRSGGAEVWPGCWTADHLQVS